MADWIPVFLNKIDEAASVGIAAVNLGVKNAKDIKEVNIYIYIYVWRHSSIRG